MYCIQEKNHYTVHTVEIGLAAQDECVRTYVGTLFPLCVCEGRKVIKEIASYYTRIASEQEKGEQDKDVYIVAHTMCNTTVQYQGRRDF